MHPSDFERVKNLPVKSRTGRSVAQKKELDKDTALVYIHSTYKQEFYKVETNHTVPIKSTGTDSIGLTGQKERFTVTPLGFLDAAMLFRAAPDEKALPLPERHYQSVLAAHKRFDKDITDMLDDAAPSSSERDSTTEKAKRFLRWIWRDGRHLTTKENCDILSHYVELGTFTRLSRELNRMERRYRQAEIDLEEVEKAIRAFVIRYHKSEKRSGIEEDPNSRVILAEYFE